MEGVRKVLLYRLTEVLFNENVRSIFNSAVPHSPDNTDDSIGNCLGYLTLFVWMVGVICDARMWISFIFRGPRSMIRLSDGAMVLLHPR